MTRQFNALWLMFTAACLGTVVLASAWAWRGPGAPEPREVYAVVLQHLAACRAGDYPLAYHSAASGVQERLGLVQYERELRRAWRPVAGRDHVELGPAQPVRGERHRATVEVFFVLPRGEVIARRYNLVREQGDWKIDGTTHVAGGEGNPPVRLAGVRS